MKKQALIFGLAAGLYAFVFTWIGGQVFGWLEFRIPIRVLSVIMLAASYLIAFKIAGFIEGEDEPPPLLIVLLLFCAGYYLLARLVVGIGIGFGTGKFALFAHSLAQWALVATCLFTTRFIRPRIMLFLGVSAFAMQFHAALVLGMFTMRVPEWLLELITFIVAVLIARALCFGEESPADRVGNPLFLWLFSATGTLSLIITVHELLLPDWAQIAVWFGFLASFVLLVRQIEPDDPDHRPSPLGASFGLMFMVFIGMFSAVGSVFHVSDIVGDWIPFAANNLVQVWLPIGATAVLAAAILRVLELGQRIRPEGPGRTALLWGVILYFVGVLAGGSIFGVVSPEGKFFEFLAAFVYLILLVVPIMVAAQVLMGIGLLRILFNLDPRPN